ncbi:4-hydroxy-tetrahydrodipicolinate reductase [Marinoscillum luteum]|jgi:4-hydroxy-tetrahydrodipicolinate reductase|uniref:4-hydroxy-tetrahydrodipicolinate reductase n=1 Tax=Marinoscillum luteum TaxID=861051 RepID=A0ABW7N4B4_9BACT
MRIALIGYGKMGKSIEQIARTRGHQISYIIDQDNHSDIQKISPDNTDIAIEFSQPSSAFDNITTLLSNKVKTMAGTTGWLDRYDEVKALCTRTNGTFLYASNYSVGVNLFFELNEWLAKKMSQLEDFVPEMVEIHHTEKKDAPSGTAITLAEGIQKNDPSVKKWVNESSEDHHTLGIISKREANVPGTHTVTYRSPLETIEITHVAHDRKVFAEGVIKVAEWATNQTGILSIREFLNNQS